MLTLSDFLDPNTASWNCIHCWVTNSSVDDLISRLLLFGSDVFTTNEILSHSENRAFEIANSKTSLSTLIGGNVQMLPNEPINGALFLHQQQSMIPRWRRVALAFQRMNHGLKELKYEPRRRDDPNYRQDPHSEYGIWDTTSKHIADAGDVLTLGAYQLERRFMALPALAVLIPIFRYLLNILIHFTLLSFF